MFLTLEIIVDQISVNCKTVKPFKWFPITVTEHLLYILMKRVNFNGKLIGFGYDPTRKKSEKSID